MSLSQGTLGLARFLALGPVPNEETLTAALAQDRFRPFEDGLEEERLGWCDWRNPLILPAEPNWITQDRFALFGLRIDTRKVPGSFLNAHVALRLRQLMQDKDLAFVGKEARISIQDEVRAELLPKITPSMKIADIAWDLKGGMLWTTAGSTKVAGALQSLFIKSFGVELQPLHPLLLAGRVCPHIPTEQLMALDPLDLEAEEVG